MWLLHKLGYKCIDSSSEHEKWWIGPKEKDVTIKAGQRVYFGKATAVYWTKEELLAIVERMDW